MVSCSQTKITRWDAFPIRRQSHPQRADLSRLRRPAKPVHRRHPHLASSPSSGCLLLGHHVRRKKQRQKGPCPPSFSSSGWEAKLTGGIVPDDEPAVVLGVVLGHLLHRVLLLCLGRHGLLACCWWVQYELVFCDDGAWRWRWGWAIWGRGGEIGTERETRGKPLFYNLLKCDQRVCRHFANTCRNFSHFLTCFRHVRRQAYPASRNS